MNKQPSFGQWLPVSLMVGILAGLSVYIFTVLFPEAGYGWAGAVWVLFISWGGWFSVRAKMKRLPKFILSVTGGVVFGVLTLIVFGYLSPFLGDWALAVTVFLAATSIVLLELTSILEVAFVYFFAYAGYFAYVFGGFGDTVDSTGAVVDTSFYQEAGYFWILLMAGVGFALVNVWLKNILFKIERVPLDQRNTIFDKE